MALFQHVARAEELAFVNQQLLSVVKPYQNFESFQRAIKEVVTRIYVYLGKLERTYNKAKVVDDQWNICNGC